MSPFSASELILPRAKALEGEMVLRERRASGTWVAASERAGLSQALAIGRELLIGCVLLGMVVTAQLAAGAYRGERAAYSDEASHFMNALLVRDYVTDGLGRNPLKFAEQYYLNYPKIAWGMWPPLFHASLGIFMLAGSSPQGVALALLAVLSAWTAWRLSRFVSLFETRFVALLIAATFVLTSAITDLTTAIMLDLALAALALEATYWFAVFVSTGERRHAAIFGVLTAMCCLTKGNGLSVVLVPASLLLFTRRFEVLRRSGLYIAAAIVLIFAVPPLAVSYRLDAAIGDFGPIRSAEVIGRMSLYSSFVLGQFGAPMLTLSIVGLVVGLRPNRQRHLSLESAAKASLAALVIGAVVFHLFNPHLIAAPRYIALMIAPLLGLLPVGVEHIARALVAHPMRRSVQAACLAGAFVTFLAARPAMANRHPIGARATIDYLDAQRGLSGATILVISNEEGEGALVSEVASRHFRPAATVIRGSKLVAMDDWAGNHFRMLFASSGDLLKELEDLHVDYLVLDCSPQASGLPYWGQVKEMVETHADRVEQNFETHLGRRMITYQLKRQTPGPAKRLEIPLTYSLGRVLGR
jgi:hypothetical protein